MQKRINMIVCGHIDHGKSTFVGKLMNELGLIPEDRLLFLKNNSNTERIEYSHLIDSLANEKAQGITISLSQMAFKYKDQEFAFLDAPGHFEFMQNMITGASKADMAFLLVDAVEGIKESTLRHLFSLSFIGVQSINVLINKMDLVHYSEKIFSELKNELLEKFTELDMTMADCIPISAYLGENLHLRSQKILWFNGPTVSETLEIAKAKNRILLKNQAFRFVVHDVYSGDRENMIVGELISGQLSENQTVMTYSLNVQNQTKIRLQPKENELNSPIYNGEKYKTLFTDLDAPLFERGSILFIQNEKPLHFTNEFTCSLFNFGQQNISCGDSVQIKLAKQTVTAQIKIIDRLINCSDLKQLEQTDFIPKGHVAYCQILTAKPIVCDLFEDDSRLGRLVIIKDHMISAAGKIIKVMT